MHPNNPKFPDELDEVSKTEYEVKTFGWEHRGFYPIMVVRFVNEFGDFNEVLSSSGWRGEYYLFLHVDIRSMDMSNDPTKMAYLPGSLRDFMFGIKDGPLWEEVEDGEVYEPEDFGL